MTKTTTGILLLCALFFASTSFAQNQVSQLSLKIQNVKNTKTQFQPVTVFSNAQDVNVQKKFENELAEGTILNLEMSALKSLFNNKHEAIELSLPRAEKSDLIVDLVLHQTLADGFQVTTSESNGQGVDWTPGLYYRGTVRGSQKSLAAISIFEDEIIGVVDAEEEGNMVLGKTGYSKSEYVFYKTDDFLIDQSFECGVDEPGFMPENLKQLQDVANAGNTKAVANCVNVYLECEYDMYQENGSSVSNTTNQMTGIFNVVATIYQNEMITTNVSEIFVWSTPDSYSTSSTSNALTSFRNLRSSYNGDLAHLISRGAPSGGGVAWVDALCTSYGYAYSYINSTYAQLPTYSWTVNVIAHEMGHNLGSSHTHACVWNGNNTAYDGCGPAAGYSEGCDGPLPTNGGTTMSYCHLVSGIGINMNNGFGDQPGDLIRAEVTNASCLSACGPPCNLTVSVTGTNANGGNNGTANAAASSGTTPYNYAWSNGGSGSSLTGLAPGTYTCTVTDAASCVATGSYTVLDVTPCTGSDMTLTIVLDNYPEETSWDVKDSGGTVVASSGGTYAGQADGATVVETFCLPDACYDFTIYDSYGDGICCGYGNGSYSLVDDASGTSVASGGSFGSSEVTNFCVPTGGPTNYTLTTGTNGNGSVTAGGTYPDGTALSLTATPDAGYQFDNWSGDLGGSTNPISFTITSNMNVTANFSEISGGGCTPATVNSTGFDSSWGIWNDGGSDCRRSANDAAYAVSPSRCVRLRDNTSTSVATTDDLDLSEYDNLTVTFTYYVRSFENTEDFWLQISTNGGGSYTTVEDWVRGTDFNNDERKYDSVVVPGPFTANTRVRFRCDASGNSDWVYIDDVTLDGGCNGSPMINPSVNNGNNNSTNVDLTSEDELKVQKTAMKLFPNPVATQLTVAYNIPELESGQLIVMDFTGKILNQKEVAGGLQEINLDVSHLNAGYYMVHLITDNGRVTKKFVVAK